VPIVERARSALRKNAASLRYAALFALIGGALFAVYCFPYAEHGGAASGFAWYLAGYARLAGSLLALGEPSLQVVGNRILGRFSIEIVKNCDAMEANILFVSAVLAFPATLWRRLVAMSAGLLVLIAANLLRICALYYIGAFAHSVFEFAHMELFPLLLVVIAVVEFVLWTNWMQRDTLRLPA
jgi:exosortase/archaeosortase family protein